ncbi:MAG TPA: NAD(P)H-dependent oxidoreductase subunit E, partial [Micromonosporaceae bacterium]
LGVGHDETTEDGKITLEHAECLAACDYGPVMTVNYDFFDNVDPQSALGVVEELRAGGRPMPTRGARLCTLKEMAVQLAGFADERDGAVADGGPGEPTLRGLRLAEQHGISVPGFDPNTPIRSKAESDKAAAEAKAKAEAAKPAPAVAPVRGGDGASAPTGTPGNAGVGEPAPAAAATGSTAPDVKAPDDKSPEIRAAETRQPDARTAVPDAPGTKVPTDSTAPAPRDAREAEAAGVAANAPAGDGKPAGDEAAAQERNLKEAEAGTGTGGPGSAVASETGVQK